MKISILEATSNKVLDQRDVTWEEIKELLSTHETRYSDKKLVPMFSPCEFQIGKPRSNATAIAIHFGVIDCDDITKEELATIQKKLALYSYVCYTSWSHTKEKEDNNQLRLRFVFPFDKPIPRNDWNKIWQKLNTFFNEKLDQNCKDMQRGYYLPACTNPSEHWVKNNNGICFDAYSIGEKLSLKAEYDLIEFATKLRKKKSEHNQLLLSAIENGMKGLPVSVSGNRDTTLLKLAHALVEQFPNASPEELEKPFLASIAYMQAEEPGKNTPTWFLDKLIRAKAKQDEKLAEKKEQQDTDLSSRIREAFGQRANRSHPYSPQEIEQFANEAGCSVTDFKRRWIMHVGGSHYIFKNGDYMAPKGEKDLLNSCHIHLAPAYSAGVDIFKTNAKGDLVPKNRDELLLEYGTPISKLQASLFAQKATYDNNTQTFTEAPCPIRYTKGEFDKEVSTFIELMAGPDAERLKDFISAITLLDRPSAAIYLHGPKGHGKNVLTMGLTRLWKEHGEPTKLSAALKDFNGSISACPLVFADETMPEAFRKSGNTGELREFIQSTARSLRRLYKEAADLLGATRLIIAANNLDLLNTGESHSKNDIEAIVDRICLIDCRPAVAAFLEELRVKNGWNYIDDMINSGRIARHAIWLRDNHVIANPSRFIISGMDSALHRKMAIGEGLAATILHWLVSYLQNPNLVDANSKGLIRIKDNELLITSQVLNDHWMAYDTHRKPPALAHVTKALAMVCLKERRQIRYEGKNIQYRVVDTANLVEWAELNGYGSEKDILNYLSKDTRIKFSGILDKGEVV